jgi:dGTPase
LGQKTFTIRRVEMPSNKALWDKADSLHGCLSHLKTKGGSRRHRSEDSGPIYDDGDSLHLSSAFLGDEAKLLMSKAFRIMRDKTQVFTFPKTSLIRSRQSHVVEVVANTIVACDMLGLNVELGRAAATGHDIGHVPFGHQGEAWMAKAMGKPFCHEVMGPIIAQKVERSGRGLNLTWHTLDAMMRHSGNTARPEMSSEAWVLRYTDKFAYLFADYNDIVGRMRWPVSKELKDLVESFGQNQRERGTTAIAGLIIESSQMGQVSFEHSEIARKFHRLRSLMYELYPRVTQQNVAPTLERVMEFLTQLDVGDPFLLLALMTDRDVDMVADATVKDMQVFNQTTVSEILPHLEAIGQVDLCDPDLNWQ